MSDSIVATRGLGFAYGDTDQFFSHMARTTTDRVHLDGGFFNGGSFLVDFEADVRLSQIARKF